MYSVKMKMVSTQHSSNDYRAFVQHMYMAPLRTAITDPGGLALELYSEGLIDNNYVGKAENQHSVTTTTRA